MYLNHRDNSIIPVDMFTHMFKSLSSLSRKRPDLEMWGAKKFGKTRFTIYLGDSHSVEIVEAWMSDYSFRGNTLTPHPFGTPSTSEAPRPSIRPKPPTQVTCALPACIRHLSPKEIFDELTDRSKLLGEAIGDPKKTVSTINREGQEPYLLHLLSFDADPTLLESIVNHIKDAATEDGSSRREVFCFPVFITRVRCQFSENRARYILGDPDVREAANAVGALHTTTSRNKHPKPPLPTEEEVPDYHEHDHDNNSEDEGMEVAHLPPDDGARVGPHHHPGSTTDHGDSTS